VGRALANALFMYDATFKPSLAEATVRFADEIEPQLFTLENVWGYRKSRSWKLIREHLQRSGYDWNAWKMNAANYGVPQTRKRMIVAARKDGPRPKKPPATHAEDPQTGGLFGGDLNEWVGWYEAIDDLIPSLPETELADWQKDRLPDDLLETTYFYGNDIRDSVDLTSLASSADEPMGTVKSNVSLGRHRAVLVEGTGNQWSSDDASVTTEDADEPVGAIRAAHYKGMHRAVLVSNAYDTPQDGEDRKPQTYDDEDPSPPTTVQHDGRLRAVLVNATSNMQVADGEHPAYGQVARVRSYQQRAVLGRRVVQMTPRALARFQTFPDWYDLPDSKSLACRIIGNAVPPLAMTKWIEHWTE